MKRWFIISSVLILLLSACSSWKRPLGEEIVGTWINAEGYEVEFYAGGQGFIPGVKGEIPIPDTPFSYSIEGGSKLFLVLPDGTTLELQVTIEGDKMSWDSAQDGITFEYTRVK